MNVLYPLKLSISTLTALIFSALLFTGCDTFDTQTVQSFKNPHAEVGQLHNQALDHVLSDLKTVQGTIKSKEELFETAESSLQAFAREKGADAHQVDDVRWGMKMMTDAPKRVSRAQARSGVDDPLPRAVAIVPDSVLADLTSGQKRYFEEIASLVDSNPSLTQFEEQLSTLSQSAVDELGEEDAAVVLQASAVAKSSYAYWAEHYGEWMITMWQAQSDSLTATDGNASSTSLTAENAMSAKGGCDWSDEDADKFLAQADDVTWADLGGSLIGGWGAIPASVLQAIKEYTDEKKGDSENDYFCSGV